MLSGVFRFFAGFGAKSRFQQSLIRATYYGDHTPPQQPDITVLLEAFRNNDPETRAQVAITSLFQRLEKSQERREWVFVMKNLVVMDRSVEEHLMLEEISGYESPYLEHYQGRSADTSQLLNRLVQNYFRYVRSKAMVYLKRKSVLSAPKAQRSSLIQKLPTGKLFQQLTLNLTIIHLILQLNQSYKNGSKRPQIVQYVFGLLLSTLFCCHSIQYRCLGSLIYKASSMDVQNLGRLRQQIQRMDKSTTKSIMIFVENNKEMECFKEVKYKDLFRFGGEFLGPIDELLKNCEVARQSRFSEDHLVVQIDQSDLTVSGVMDGYKKQNSVIRRNKHFTAGPHRKDIHYTKNDDKDEFGEFVNGYSAMFSVAVPEMKELTMVKQSSSNMSKVFDRVMAKVLEYSRAAEVEFKRELWEKWENIYAQPTK